MISENEFKANVSNATININTAGNYYSKDKVTEFQFDTIEISQPYPRWHWILREPENLVTIESGVIFFSVRETILDIEKYKKSKHVSKFYRGVLDYYTRKREVLDVRKRELLKQT